MNCERKSRVRGLEELRRRVGDITAEIDARLRSGQPARVLEVGFGSGTALLELARRYGERVELHGVNKSADHGHWERLKTHAAERGILPAAELQALPSPQLHFFDVSEGLRFPDNHFDVIYSQAAFFYFPDKAKFLEEVNRVLKVDGVARIDVMMQRRRLPPNYAACLEIADGGKTIPFWTYIEAFDNLKKKHVPRSRLQAWIDRLLRRKRKRPKRQPYLEMRKSGNFDMKLQLSRVIDLHAVCDKWWGCQSLYQIRK